MIAAMARVLLPLALVTAVVAQAPDAPAPASAEQLLREKLAQPVLARGSWCTDYDLARERAAAQHQLIFGYFTTAGH